MIRDAVIHLLNEQPILADLMAMPTASDVGLVCTNLRTLDGKRPVFIDREDSVFFFPYLHIRFVEIHAGSVPGEAVAASPAAADSDDGPRPAEEAAPAVADDEDLEIDEDFLRRVREA